MFDSTASDGEREKLGKKWKNLIEITKELERNKIANISALLSQKMYLYRSIERMLDLLMLPPYRYP